MHTPYRPSTKATIPSPGNAIGHSTVTGYTSLTRRKGLSLCFGVGLCVLRPSSSCSTHQASSLASCSACDGKRGVAATGIRIPQTPVPSLQRLNFATLAGGPAPRKLTGNPNLTWASALGGASSGTGFSEVFSSPFVPETLVGIFFFFCFIDTVLPTGRVLVAESQAGCTELRSGASEAPEAGRGSRGLRGER